MFNTFTKGALLFLVVTVSLVFWRLFHIHEQTVTSYQELMNWASASDTENIYQSTQGKRNIIKTVLLSEGPEKRNIQLKAAYSQMVADKLPSHIDWLEKMQQMECVIQEKLYYILPDGREVVRAESGELVFEKEMNASLSSDEKVHLIPMQHVRWIEADQACYSYFTNRLTAESVKIALYCFPGHEINFPTKEDPKMMNASSSSVSFALSKELSFQAEQFKATFMSQGAL